MVIWEEYLIGIASAMGVSSTDAGMMISLMFSIFLMLVVLIATKGKQPAITLSFPALFSTVLFTFMGWYPIWIGSVLALVISLLLAMYISGKF